MKLSMKTALPLCTLIIAELLTGCTTPISDGEIIDLAMGKIKDPQQNLQITVTSEPAGADVFGVTGQKTLLTDDERAGTYLGKTPLTLTYTRAHGRLFGNYPDETLDMRESEADAGRPAEAYLGFKCLVLKDGFQQVRLNKIIEYREYDEMDINAVGSVTSLDSGKRVDVHVKLKSGHANYGKLKEVVAQGAATPAVTKPDVDRAASGTVDITSDPAGSEIFVNGEFAGNAPCQIPLPAGTHTIEARHSGYKPNTRKIKIYSGGKASYRATLVQE